MSRASKPTRPSAEAMARTRAVRRKQERAARRSKAPRAVMLAMILVALLISSFYPARTLIAKRNQVAAMRRTSSSLDAQIADLKHQRDWLQTDEAVQQIARGTLGMVSPGETAFAVVPGHTPLPSPQTVVVQQHAQQQPGALSRWWGAFTRSLKLLR